MGICARSFGAALSHEVLIGFTLSKLYFAQRGLLSVEILYRGNRGSSSLKNSSLLTWIAAGGNADAGLGGLPGVSLPALGSRFLRS